MSILVFAALTILFSLGHGGVRIYDVFVRTNYAPGNAGLALYADILIPIIIISLLIANNSSHKKIIAN
jgi:hypothetical protein